MKYLLDTNACIGYLNGTANGVLQRLKALPHQEVVVCSIVKGELLYGAMRSTTRDETLRRVLAFLDAFVSLPFDDSSAENYGRVRAKLAERGTPIGPNDLFIAAIALSHDVTLVTHNTREFSRVEGLRLEDWET